MHPVNSKIAALEQQLIKVHVKKQRVRILCDLVANYDKKFCETKDVFDRQTAINYGCEVLASMSKHDSRLPDFFTALIAMQHDVIFRSSTPPEMVELEGEIF